jgi:type IV secretory pathway VirB2 component (pilin)
MNAFEQMVNLLVLMGALSVAAERLANALKLGHPDLRQPRRQASRAAEKERERRIGNRVLVVSVLLAIGVKADFFAMMSHLEAPWETLGWSRGVPFASPLAVLSTIAGMILTGLALGFGSKFWHDALDVVGAARNDLRGLRRHRHHSVHRV